MSVAVRFVAYEANESSRSDPDMQNAFDLCEQYRSNGMDAEWISSEDCLNMTEFTKKDVFVLHKFKGPVFDKLVTTTAVVIGPRCLSCCLTEGSEIPPGPDPVFTIAMRNLVVTISLLDADTKIKYGIKIKRMGGRYENVLSEETTHLISGTVLSDKYIKATARKIKIMSPEWVNAVWESSLEKNISATSPQFDKYSLPVFFNLYMCSTGFTKSKKKELTNLVESNGGIMMKTYETEKVKILVVDISAITSEKYKVSQQFDIPCVSADWVHKSVELGYSVDYKDYIMQTTKTSSPNRPSQLPNMSLDFSIIPNIRSLDNNETFMTMASDMTDSSSTTKREIVKNPKRVNRFDPIAKELAQIVDSIDIKDVKRSGLFLDGCFIFVYGLTATRREKLQRVVARAGAVRYDQPVEAVTHAICGDPSSASQSTYQSTMPCAVHVTVRWLADSIHARKALEETPYLVFSGDRLSDNKKKNVLSSASPMSKRNLQLLRTPLQLPPVPLFSLGEDEEKDEVIQQYIDHKNKTTVNEDKDTLEEYVADNTKSDNTMKSKDKSIVDNNQEKTLTQAQNSDDDSEVQEMIFEGITFELQDIDDASEQITERILESGGVMVPPGKGGSYIIVPMDCDDVKVTSEDSKIVTSLWLDDCILKKTLLPVEYYHKPVKTTDAKPLENLVFAISTYTGSEREFLMEVATLFGARVQPSLQRRDTANAFRSTHLICSEASSAKYNGAVNWGLPVVTSQWLLNCVMANERLSEKPYLLGKSAELYKIPDDSVRSNANEKANITSKNNKENETVSEKLDSIITNIQVHKNTDDSIKGAANVTYKENETTSVKTDALIENVQIEPKIVNMKKEEQAKLFTPPTKASKPNATPLPRSSSKLLADNNVDMSPGSRYIAMARQGLLGFESQESPKRVSEAPRSSPHNLTMSTPPIDNALATPNLALFSPTTRRRVMAIKRGERPSNPPRTPKNIFESSIATPESPFGSALNMPKESRKRLKKLCDDLKTPSAKLIEKQETPVSELCKKYFTNRINSGAIEKPAAARALDIDNADTPPAKQRKLSENLSVNSELQLQLQQLNSILTDSSNCTPKSFKGKRSFHSSPAQTSTFKTDTCLEHINEAVQIETVDSQLNTVGWDDMSESGLVVKNPLVNEEPPKVYKFMISTNVDNAEEIKMIIERLGGEVLDNTGVDLTASHLLCTRLGRSEKFLGCLAAGKWILHPSYIVRCQEAGVFIDEELYEWGNPKSDYCGNEENEKKFAAAVYRWRLKRTNSEPPPFENFKIIMHVQEERKCPLLRVLLAGGGEVVEASPPYRGSINATHCLVEQKRLGLSQSDMAYFASRRIPVCPPLLLNSILVESTPPTALESAYPEYRQLLKD